MLGTRPAIWVDELHQSGECLPNAILVSRGQCRRQFEILLEPVAVIDITQIVQDLSQIVDHKAESTRKHFGADLLEFPAGQIEVDTIQKRRIMVLRGQLFEQIGVLQHIRYIVRRIAHEYHARLTLERLNATRERLVGHVILHDIHQVASGLFGFARELVERHRIPIANESQPSVGIVHEQLRHRHFTTGDEHAMRREF